MYKERSVKNSRILVNHDSVIPASPLRGKIIRGRSNAERNSPIPDLAIGIALTVRKLFKLPLRHTEGFIQSLLDPLGRPWRRPITRRCRVVKKDLPIRLGGTGQVPPTSSLGRR